MSKTLTALTAFMLLATIAQARPEWLYKPVAGGIEGEYTEQRVEGYGYPKPEGSIYQGQARTQAFRDVERDQVDIETGETNTIAVSEPVPPQEAYYTEGMDAPREATAQEIADREAAVTAAQQAAQAAAIEAMLSRQVDAGDPTQGTARKQIIKIEGVVEWFIQAGSGVTRPVKVAPTVQAINTFIEHLEQAEMWAAASKAQRYATTLVAGISGFEKQGITAEQIHAAWLFMGSPLPEQ